MLCCSAKGMENRAMLTHLIRFLEEDTGVTFIEYALIAALVSIVIVGFLTNMGATLTDWFFTISGELTSVANGI